MFGIGFIELSTIVIILGITAATILVPIVGFVWWHKNYHKDDNE